MTQPPEPPARSTRRVLTTVALVVGSLVTLLCWSLASPPASGPDDIYHLSSVWCAQGDRADRCLPVEGDPTARLVPGRVLGANCFAYDPNKSASCQREQDSPTPLKADGLAKTGNWTGGYPPVFYRAMSVFITDDLASSVILMRVANCLLALGAVAVLCLLVPRHLRAAATLPLLLAAIPLTLFFVPSTNPSSWGLISAATLWLAFYAAFESQGRRRNLLLVYTAVMTLVGAGARSDSALFCVMAIGLVMVMRYKVLVRNKLAVGAGLLCALVAVLLFFSTGLSSAVTQGFATSAEPGAAAPGWFALTVYNLQALPNILFGGIGFGFMASTGWLDTPFPAVVGFLPTAVWVSVVFSTLRTHAWAKTSGLLLVGSALVLYPTYLLARSGLMVGNSFQPRYVLPLLIIFTGISLLEVRREGPLLNRAQALVAAAALSVAHLVALNTEIRRYVTGLDGSGFNLDRRQEWWWGGPISAQGVWLLGSVAFAVVSVVLLLSVSAPRRRPHRAAPEATEVPGEVETPAAVS